MARTMWPLALPAIVLMGTILPHHIQHAHSCAIAAAFLVLVTTSACLQRPFRMERVPVRLLALLLVLPAATTAFVAARLGPHGRFALMSALCAWLCACLLRRIWLAYVSLPSRKRRLPTILDAVSPRCMAMIRAELALLWFGLFRWRRAPADRPPQAMAFPSTGSGIELAMCWLMISSLAIETPLFHVLARHVWTAWAAWVSTGLHMLLILYLAGYAKSLSLRPTLLFPDRIEIRLGAIAGRIIPLSDIEHVTPHDGCRTVPGTAERLFGLDAPNLCLKAGGSSILFRVDTPAALIAALT